ncbi:MAG: hypothetical protein ACOYU3_09560 [Bacillota bacterium]
MQDIQIVIDIGTNSVRLLAARQGSSRLETLHKRLVTTRLGRDVGGDGRLDTESIERTVNGVCELLEWGRMHYGDAPVRVFATSALREAPNSSDFTGLLSRRTGLDVHIVSGEEEAQLAFAGAVETDRRSGVIDIGGGSTELMIGEAGRIGYMQSVQLGVVRLRNLLDLSGILSKDEEAVLRDAVRLGLEKFTLSREAAAGAEWVGVGGTVTVLAAIEARLTEYSPQAIQKLHLDIDTVRGWYARLINMELEEKKRLHGLPQDRADIIAGGACILLGFMERFGVERLKVSDRDNLEGYLKRYGPK